MIRVKPTELSAVQQGTLPRQSSVPKAASDLLPATVRLSAAVRTLAASMTQLANASLYRLLESDRALLGVAYQLAAELGLDAREVDKLANQLQLYRVHTPTVQLSAQAQVMSALMPLDDVELDDAHGVQNAGPSAGTKLRAWPTTMRGESTSVSQVHEALLDDGFVVGLFDSEGSDAASVSLPLVRQLVLKLAPKGSDLPVRFALLVERNDARVSMGASIVSLARALSASDVVEPSALRHGFAIVRQHLAQGVLDSGLLGRGDRQLLVALYATAKAQGLPTAEVDELAHALEALRKSERAVIAQRAFGSSEPSERTSTQRLSEPDKERTNAGPLAQKMDTNERARSADVPAGSAPTKLDEHSRFLEPTLPPAAAEEPGLPHELDAPASIRAPATRVSMPPRPELPVARPAGTMRPSHGQDTLSARPPVAQAQAQPTSERAAPMERPLIATPAGAHASVHLERELRAERDLRPHLEPRTHLDGHGRALQEPRAHVDVAPALREPLLPPNAALFGSSAQLAARSAGAYRSLAPPPTLRAPSASEALQEQDAVEGAVHRQEVAALPQRAVPSLPVEIAQALGVAPLFAQLRDQAVRRAALRARRANREPEREQPQDEPEVAPEAAVDEGSEQARLVRRRERWRSVLMRRKRARRRR